MGIKQSVLWKFRQIYMVDADVARLSSELLAAFPRLRFVDVAFRKPGDGEVGSAEVPGIPYFPALTDTRNPRSLYAWLEPEGWRPLWQPPARGGTRALGNMPKKLFDWSAPVLRVGSWGTYTGRNILDHATLNAPYARDDKEHLQSINKAWRILKRIAVNNVEMCQNILEMEAVLGPIRYRRVWIGHEALKWLYGDPQRAIWHRHRPADAIDRAPGWWS